ncbi:MAG TPA: terminase gpA endonuclease subunit, partial [Terrimicrobiaceae bacterium]|nr:terminase gpA endonuclease subunit [Terrimicrobiaceae bacterium]
ALPYEPKYEAKVEVHELQAALEAFDAVTVLPAGVLVITLGCDVQADRVECSFWGWGLESQCWLLQHEVVYGSPEHPATWRALDEQTRREWTHPSGHKLRVQCACVDAAYRQSFVMRYTSPRFRRNVFAVRGSPTLGKALMESKPQIRGRPPGPLWFVGTNEAKDVIYQRLELVREVLERGGPGPGATFPHGYIHLPLGTTPDFLAQLTAEDSSMKQLGGQWFRAFENPDKRRNEALDMAVYALAGERYLNPQYAVIAAKLAPPAPEGAPAPAKVEKRTVRKRVDRRRRWVV